MHQASIGIDVEELKEPRKHGRNVGVHQFEQPEPDEQQQRSLEQLEHRDGGHPGMVPARTSHAGKYLYHKMIRRVEGGWPPLAQRWVKPHRLVNCLAPQLGCWRWMGAFLLKRWMNRRALPRLGSQTWSVRDVV